jgi:hypothetical protein
MSKDHKVLVVIGRQVDGKGPIEVLQRGGSLANEFWDEELIQPRMLTIGGAKQRIKRCQEIDCDARRTWPDKIPNYNYMMCPITFRLVGDWAANDEVPWPGSKEK